MYSVDQIYIYYKKSQALAKNRGYKLPKDLKSHIEKMNANNRKNLLDITSKFNTVYHNVDPLEYFNCGFTLFKNFNYHQFSDERIINLYIVRDKNAKRESKLSKKAIIDSVKFMLKYLKENGNIKPVASPFVNYCCLFHDDIPIPIHHYIMNKIDKYFLTWLIRDGFISVDDSLKNYIPFIIDNYRDITYDLRLIDNFLFNIKEKVG